MALQNPRVTSSHPFQIHLTSEEIFESRESCEEYFSKLFASCRALQHIEERLYKQLYIEIPVPRRQIFHKFEGSFA